MSTEDLSPSSAKKGRVDSNCEINKLADADLEAVFKRLPPYDRLLVSEVCKRWHAIASISWLDVTKLDLSLIPDNIAAIVKRCPNLRIVNAVRQALCIRELRLLSRLSLRSVQLYDCTTPADVFAGRCRFGASALFPRSLAAAAWDELVLHNFLGWPHVSGCSCCFPLLRHAIVPDSFPAELKRLQISCSGGVPHTSDKLHSFVAALVQLRALECLLLHDAILGGWLLHSQVLLTNNDGTLRNLRELYLMSHSVYHVWRSMLSLTNLQTLFLGHCLCSPDDDFDWLVTKHPALRILAFTGIFNFHKEFPVRLRYANGCGSDPLPVLHVFVGRMASGMISFPKFPPNAAKVYPITEPLPQFLGREEIAPIFEGVWIAEKIKEADKNGLSLTEY